MIVTRIGVWSAAKIAGILYAALGLIVGAIFALVSMLGVGISAVDGGEALPAWFGLVFGVGAVVGAPILYGVMGLVMGAIGAALYNLFAGLVGGLQVEMRPTTTT